MTKLMTVAVAMLLALSMPRRAHAGEAFERALQEAIRMEDERARDSEQEVRTDEGLVAEIAKTIPSRLQRADQADARAQAFRNAATALRRRGKVKVATAFENLARAENKFGKNDRLEASERGRAKDILQKQANIARNNAELHKAHAAELRAQLEAIQNMEGMD